jgi:hypothetical protein
VQLQSGFFNQNDIFLELGSILISFLFLGSDTYNNFFSIT